MRGAILILNYNAGDALLRCLRSLAASDAADLPILLVDNDSRDGSSEKACAAYPDLELMQRPDNAGFAAGVNTGVNELLNRGFDAVLLLNPDTVVGESFFAPLAQALEQGAAVAGPKLLSAGTPLRIWSAGGAVTFGLNLARLGGHGRRDRGQFDRPSDVSFLPATVWYVRADCWDEVGPFDEHFFCYLEDADYCVRVRRAGKQIRYEPASVVVHEGSRSSGGGYTALRKYLNAWGAPYFMRKHGDLGSWLRFLLTDVATLPLALLAGVLRGRTRAAWWKVRGLWDGFRRVPLTTDVLTRLHPGGAFAVETSAQGEATQR